MAKVYPYTTTTTSSHPFSSERETFTIWMKSLVLHGNGCTVFDSNGEIVYRVDNYDSKCSNEVYIMDLQGKVLCSILRKKLQIFGQWDGYKSDVHKMKNEKPWFQVRENRKFLKGDSVCEVTVGCNKAQSELYQIVGVIRNKFAFKIIDSEQQLLAEVKQKQSSSGVVLGNDVLSLVVEPHVDCSLIIALVAVHGLISHKM